MAFHYMPSHFIILRLCGAGTKIKWNKNIGPKYQRQRQIKQEETLYICNTSFLS